MTIDLDEIARLAKDGLALGPCVWGADDALVRQGGEGSGVR